MIARLAARAAVALGAVASLLIVAAPIASAHTNFVGSEPPTGSVLAAAPERATLSFSENLSGPLTSAEMTTAAGTKIAGVTWEGSPGHPTDLVVHLPSGLAKDAYRLSYAVRDPSDLHETKGSIVFSVGVALPAGIGASSHTLGPPAEAFVRWLVRVALALVLGALALALIVLPRATVSSRTRASLQQQLLVWARAALVVTVVGQVGQVALLVRSFGLGLSKTWSVLVSASSIGQRFVAVFLVAATCWSMLASLARLAGEGRLATGHGPATWRRTLGGNAVWAGPVILSLTLAVLLALDGHRGSGPGWISVALRATHIASLGVWVGLLLLIGVLTRRDRPSGRAVLQAASPAAVIAAIGLTLSGVALSGRVITSLTALFATTYGRVLLIKIMIVVVAFAIGAAGRLRRFESGWRTRLAAEAFLGAALVLSGSVLSVSEPALGAQYSPLEAQQVRPPVSEQPNDLVLRISLDPGRPGPNAVSVEVLNTRRPVPAKTSNVEAVITPVGAKPIVLSATVPSDGNRYDLGSALLTSPGDATVTATVRRAGFPDTVVSAPFAIEPLPIPRHTTIISSREMRPWTDLLAAIGTAIVAVVIGARVSRRRREPDNTPAHTATGEGPSDPVTEVRHPQSALR